MGGGVSKPPTAYQPTGQPGADAGYLGYTKEIGTAGSNLTASTVPQLQTLARYVIDNPYTIQAQTGVNNAANIGQTQVGPSQLASAANITSMVPLTEGAGLRVLDTGFDPQQTLYNRQFQQMQDQQNAINAQNGVAGTPYAAGVAGQAAQDFNTNWQNQQLARQVQALGAWNSALGAAGTAATTGANIGTQGLDTMVSSAQLPADLYAQQQFQDMQALQQQIAGTSAAYVPDEQAAQNLATYLQLGQGATASAQNASAIKNQAAASSAAGLGGLLGDAMGMFKFAPITL